MSLLKFLTTTSGANLSNPINTALLLYILYSVQRIIFPPVSRPSNPVPSEFKSGYTWLPKSHPPTVLFKDYTPKTLAPFDGKDGGRILLAINGTVFDVTAGRSFYGPGKAAQFGCSFLGPDKCFFHRGYVRKLCGEGCVERYG